MKKTAKQLLENEKSPAIMVSMRLPESLVNFIDQQVKSTKIKSANRSKLIEAILTEWANTQGYKKS